MSEIDYFDRLRARSIELSPGQEATLRGLPVLASCVRVDQQRILFGKGVARCENGFLVITPLGRVFLEIGEVRLGPTSVHRLAHRGVTPYKVNLVDGTLAPALRNCRRSVRELFIGDVVSERFAALGIKTIGHVARFKNEDLAALLTWNGIGRAKIRSIVLAIEYYRPR